MNEFDEEKLRSEADGSDKDGSAVSEALDEIEPADSGNESEGAAEEAGSVKEEAEAGDEADNAEDPAEGSEEKPHKPFSDALDWVNSIIYAVAAMLVLNLFFFRPITVSGDSMNNTLVDGDRVILTNFGYSPSYGDIVVVQADKLKNKNTGRYGEPIIKRVIAVEGETIRINFTEGKVYVNDVLLEEDYIKDLTHLRSYGWMESGKTYTVPENCIFVMGDNRNISNDSRNLTDVGFVDESLIMGKVFVRFSPIKNFKWL